MIGNGGDHLLLFQVCHSSSSRASSIDGVTLRFMRETHGGNGHDGTLQVTHTRMKWSR
jgi:hypothetical protein